MFDPLYVGIYELLKVQKFTKRKLTKSVRSSYKVGF